MDKQAVLSSQNIAYHVLSKALTHDKLSHAYLFAGPQGCNKKEFATLLAQSYICEHKDSDGFACMQCSYCTRIATGNYGDMFVLDKMSKKEGSGQILKDDIQQLQHFFENTGIEVSGKRVYIIHNVDNATSEAVNSLLKFLEEPRANILAILTASSVEGVLPTIVSRCQVIHFHKNTPLIDLQQPWQYYVAQCCVKDESVEELLENSDFTLALDGMDKFIHSNSHNLDQNIMIIEKECVIDAQSKQALTYFFEGLYHIYRLNLSNPDVFQHYFAKIELFFNNPSNGLLLLRQGVQKSTKTYYMPLVFEQVMNEIKKEIL